MSVLPKPTGTIICKYAPICPPDKNCLKCANLLEMKIVRWQPQAEAPDAPIAPRAPTGTATQITKKNYHAEPDVNSKTASLSITQIEQKSDYNSKGQKSPLPYPLYFNGKAHAKPQKPRGEKPIFSPSYPLIQRARNKITKAIGRC